MPMRKGFATYSKCLTKRGSAPTMSWTAPPRRSEGRRGRKGSCLARGPVTVVGAHKWSVAWAFPFFVAAMAEVRAAGLWTGCTKGRAATNLELTGISLGSNTERLGQELQLDSDGFMRFGDLSQKRTPSEDLYSSVVQGSLLGLDSLTAARISSCSSAVLKTSVGLALHNSTVEWYWLQTPTVVRSMIPDEVEPTSSVLDPC
eukprot:CAMPEP_0171103716 /NCGR_PEP_ID=MMETSP0766_2-20121228/59190_1 /TAXON_ID=439317 /ORGANISM="Gambierdiscus australes, Strain CAWD 149" /LENGTH=201 /DNA_ID=CAMNT_0011564197 /DNA_START=92 /DNA_END=697 /DNA_ORIENTATION=+